MTQHPTPEQVQTVINSLKKIEDQANQQGAFDISEALVHTQNHECGTVHCVAGWYAVANKESPRIKTAMYEKVCGYGDGAMLMARNLGFEHNNQLDTYMMDHPEIWGNKFGDEMFCNSIAYNGLKPNSKKPMTIIIQHWQQVKKNLENLAQG